MGVEQKLDEINLDPRIGKIRQIKRGFEALPDTGDLAVRRLRLTQTGIFEIAEEILKIDSNAWIFDSLENEANLTIGFAWKQIGTDLGNINHYRFLKTSVITSDNVSIEVQFGVKLAGFKEEKLTFTPIFSDALTSEQWRDRERFEWTIVTALHKASFVHKKVENVDSVLLTRLDPHGYYQALRLNPLAFEGLSDEQIQELVKVVYRFGAKISHPDTEGGDNSAMKQINNARDFFSDPKNRRRE